MADSIYTVDPETKELTEVEAVQFKDIGIRERRDLQEWIIANPKLLGERENNLEMLKAVESQRAQVANGEKCEFFTGVYGKNRATAELRLPFDEPMHSEQIVSEAARLMKVLIDRAYPAIESILNGSN